MRARLAVPILLANLSMAVADTPRPNPAKPLTVVGTLVEDSKPRIMCGVMEVWTILHFDVTANKVTPSGPSVDPKRLPVAIPCTEMPRPGYSESAGNAGVLVKGKSYTLTIVGPKSEGNWGKGTAWTPNRIDELKKP